ncbi:hypothetical protein FQZ97_813860 [compost metagenome]
MDVAQHIHRLFPIGPGRRGSMDRHPVDRHPVENAARFSTLRCGPRGLGFGVNWNYSAKIITITPEPTRHAYCRPQPARPVPPARRLRRGEAGTADHPRRLPERAAGQADQGQGRRGDRDSRRHLPARPQPQPEGQRGDPQGRRDGQDHPQLQGPEGRRRRPAGGRLGLHHRGPRPGGHQGRRAQGGRRQEHRDPPRAHRMDQRPGHRERRLRHLPGADREHPDRRRGGHRRLGCRHLRRPVAQRGGAQQPR